MTVQELVASLTLEEKAGLCSGADFWHTKAVERLGIPAIKATVREKIELFGSANKA